MTIDRTRLFAGAATALALAAACGFGAAKMTTAKTPPAAVAKPEAEKGEEAPKTALSLTTERMKAAGIEIQAVQWGGLAAEIIAPATIVSAPDGQAVLTARASGAVTRITKRLGDSVQAGETVAIIESREAATIAADRSTAAAKAVLAQKKLARETYLFREKVSPRADLEEAQADAAAAVAETRRASAAAAAARVAGDGRSVRVVSPISGRLTSFTASLGAFVQSETELFRVANPARVQLEAAVSAQDASRITPGDHATVELTGGGTRTATVRAVTPAVNAETRAATVILTLDGGNDTLAPGQLTRVRLLPRGQDGGGPAGAVVPEDAVQTLGGRDVVFVRTPEGFRAQPVLVGRRGPGRAELLSGVTAGQQVATRNAFLLKAELSKGAEEE